MSNLSPGAEAPLTLVLQRIGAELVNCRTILADIEEAANAMAPPHGAQPGQVRTSTSEHVREMQKIDLLAQVLTDLEICILALATHDAIDGSAPLAVSRLTENLRLDDLRRRIEGQKASAPPSALAELF